MLFSTLGASSLPVVVVQPDESHANRTASVLEWYNTGQSQSIQRLVQTKKKKKTAKLNIHHINKRHGLESTDANIAFEKLENGASD